MSSRLPLRAVGSLWVCGVLAVLLSVSSVRADYIARVKEGSATGYVYIGEGAVKRQGLTGWGDVIIRDDEKVLYFIGWAREERGAGVPSSGEVAAELAAIKDDMRASGDIPVDLLRDSQAAVVEYETCVASYGMVQQRRQALHTRVKKQRDLDFRHAQSSPDALERRGALQRVATVDAYLENNPTWTDTGETAVIAGCQCTKYHVALSPIFTLDVWMTTDLGPQYRAGKMFANFYYIHQGGIPALEVLGEIPGFPLKMEGRYRNIEGRSTFRINYEVLDLIETDLDDKEFDPLGTRYPGFDRDLR